MTIVKTRMRDISYKQFCAMFETKYEGFPNREELEGHMRAAPISVLMPATYYEYSTLSTCCTGPFYVIVNELGHTMIDAQGKPACVCAHFA